MADSTPNPVTAVPADSPRPPDRPARRTFSDREKLRILDAADRCTQPGELGLLLRREGLYSFHLTSWRRWRRRVFPQHPQSRTPPTEADLRHERDRLERENARLRLKLDRRDRRSETPATAGVVEQMLNWAGRSGREHASNSLRWRPGVRRHKDR